MRTCLFLIIPFLLLGFSGFANTYTVVNNNDVGSGSLRQAIADANGLFGKDTIVFDVTLNGVGITLVTSDTITDSLVVIGSGVTNTIVNGAGLINIFVIVNNANVTFKNMTISGGARGITAEFVNGNLAVINCEMYNFIQWEAIYFDNTSRNLLIDRCYIHDNNTGVMVNGAIDFTISNSTLSNHAQGSGVETPWGVNGNTNVINNTFYLNNDGLRIVDPIPSQVVNIFNNTISDNTGIGITLSELNGTGTSVNMINNISFGNSVDFVMEDGGGQRRGQATQRASNGVPYTRQNIIGTCAISFPLPYSCPTWYSSIDPMLGMPQNNGGVTLTMAINCGGSAYNAGFDSIAILTDQRGFPRYAQTDIGAYEFQADTSSMTIMACDSYTWSANGINYTSSGTYLDTLTNMAGCDSVVTLNLTIFSSPNLSESVTDVTCFGGNDGIVDITVLGGLMPYTFQWNTGQTTEDLIGVGIGYYELTVIDANGCSAVNGKSVNEPNPINTTVSGVDASCGQDDGSATVVINSGGTAPFSYTWTSGVTTPEADSLEAGSYTVQIVDINGCSSTASININDFDGPSIVLDLITSPSCVGDNDGSIDVTISGGATPYTTNWSQGASTEDVSGLISGSYSLIVTDANGCEAIADYIVQDPIAIDLSNVIVLEASCAGSDGSATVTASGGDGNYNYQWGAAAGSVTTPIASNLGAGVYSIFVSDGNGCTATAAISINNVGGPVISEDLIVQPSCNGSTTGSVFVSVLGGTSPYTYAWDSGQITEDISGLVPGTYELTVTDQGGCIGVYVGEVNGLVPVGESICLVTVDTVSGTNKVIWTKTDTTQISHYNIYREGNAAGVYNLVGSQPVNQLSEWVDPTANPQIRAWRYRISSVDSCNNESQLSASHKTIHLISSLGTAGSVNLSWDYYDGFSYGSYYISRFYATTGWVAMDTLPSTLTSWTDPTPPGLDNSLQYEIRVLPPSGCSATKAVDHNTTRSNRHTSIPSEPQGVKDNELGLVIVYPNPNNGNFVINLNRASTTSWKYKIVDIRGKVVLEKEQNDNIDNVEIGHIEAGIYLIEISSNNQFKVLKIVVQ